MSLVFIDLITGELLLTPRPLEYEPTVIGNYIEDNPVEYLGEL